MTRPAFRRWPLLVLAMPAFVAIWSGWVGLGEKAGFGVVHPLPGILDSLTLNTAITLPIGGETYAAYALHAWLSPGLPARARRFAGWSALASLLLGAGGQVAYHLLVVAGQQTAPWWITTIVACLPVAVLGMGAALAHMMSAEHEQVTSLPDAPSQPPGPVQLPAHPLVGLDIAELLAEVDAHLAAEAARGEGERAADRARAERDDERRAGLTFRRAAWERMAGLLRLVGQGPSDEEIRRWLADQAQETGVVPSRADVREFWAKAGGSQRIDELRAEVTQARAEQAALTVPEGVEQ